MHLDVQDVVGGGRSSRVLLLPLPALEWDSWVGKGSLLPGTGDCLKLTMREELSLVGIGFFTDFLQTGLGGKGP